MAGLKQNVLSTISESTDVVVPELEKDTDPYADFALDDLFAKLKDTTRPNNLEEAVDEFTKIRRTVARLPKLQESQENLSGIAQEGKPKEYLRSR